MTLEAVEDLRAENERLREELAYYKRDNEKLNNALAFEHNESDNAKNAERWRKLEKLAETMETCKDAMVFVETMGDEK